MAWRGLRAVLLRHHRTEPAEEQSGVGRWWLAIVGWRCLGDQQLARHRYLFSPMSRSQRAVVARAWWSSAARLDCDKISCDKISCDKNGCDVLVGKQLMRPAFRCRMAAASFPTLNPLTQANPTKEACHV